MWDCIFVNVATNGDASCPNGVYVEAAVMSGGVAVDMTNGVAAAMPSWSTSSVLLEDYRDIGDSFSLRQVNCY